MYISSHVPIIKRNSVGVPDHTRIGGPKDDTCQEFLCGAQIFEKKIYGTSTYGTLIWMPQIHGGARNVIPLIVQITYFYCYKSI